MRSPIISEIFPTPKDRAERAKQLKELQGLGAVEDPPVSATYGADEVGWGADAPAARTQRGSSRSGDAAFGATAQSVLEGEEAMDALVNEAHAAFSEEAER